MQVHTFTRCVFNLWCRLIEQSLKCSVFMHWVWGICLGPSVLFQTQRPVSQGFSDLNTGDQGLSPLHLWHNWCLSSSPGIMSMSISKSIFLLGLDSGGWVSTEPWLSILFFIFNPDCCFCCARFTGCIYVLQGVLTKPVSGPFGCWSAKFPYSACSGIDTFSVPASFHAATAFFNSKASFLSLSFLILEGFFCFPSRGAWGLGMEEMVEPWGLVTDKKVIVSFPFSVSRVILAQIPADLHWLYNLRMAGKVFPPAISF